MKTKLAAGVLTLAAAVPAFALSWVIWPDPPGAPVPPPWLLPFLLVPAIFEALAFGLGVAFIVFGGRLLSRAGQPAGLTFADLSCDRLVAGQLVAPRELPPHDQCQPGRRWSRWTGRSISR